MIKASLKDLEMEMFLRMRDKGLIVWETKDGKKIPINELSDSHLTNIISFLYKKMYDDDNDMEMLENYDDTLFYDKE